ncbi:sec-independent protein translocase protein TATC, chloroplastic-like isoform X2 [Phragmites australis]|uniref:sec-independent protein translocase protein TATC, chloroplastic-like isoform X2 n=1 Tax=Phragmites australis TaxID=29695 RepID=UPI002D776B5B|nr:sec-independent protein translocase protein TATC, chloroplastic-like isoform X2 [Phragmites australis]
MGSAGALLSHPPPQLQLGGVLLLHSRPLPRPPNLPLLSFAAAAAEPQRGRRRRRRLRCAAVDGGGGPQGAGSPSTVPQREESPSGGLGAALEEPPPVENGSFGGLTQEEEQSALYNFLYPSKESLPDDKEMSIFDHLEELRERIFISVLAVGAAILGCFAFSKDLILLLEAPVSVQGVRFLQLSPGEFFFTTLKVSGYCGLLLGSPIILYEIIAFVLPGLTRDERKFLGPIVLGSSVLFYLGIFFSYMVLSPAALNFFVNYADGAVESLWSIDQYFEFILVLMFSTGLSFQINSQSYLSGSESNSCSVAGRRIGSGALVARQRTGSGRCQPGLQHAQLDNRGYSNTL